MRNDTSKLCIALCGLLPGLAETLEEMIGVVRDKKRHRIARHTWGNGV